MNRPLSGSLWSLSPADTTQDSRPLSRSLLSATPLTQTPATSTSTDRSGTPTSDKVLSGRIKKAPRKVAGRTEDVLSEKEKEEQRQQLEDMDAERKLFPGSGNWAEDELRLFKILYMRQYNPILPSHWSMDFRGIPIPDVLFASSEVHPPIINSQSDNDFKATRAFVRLIELSANVRALCQTKQRHRARVLIEKELLEYTKWAEHDGGYTNCDYLPNLIIDTVDTSSTPQEIEEHMQLRLRSAAAAHRSHWRSDELYSSHDDKSDAKHTGDDTEEEEEDEEAEPEDNRVVLIPDKYPTPSPPKLQAAHQPTPSRHANNLYQSLRNGAKTQYNRRPPVIYGLFVVNSSVMVLTIDSAKDGDDAYVSYQVEVGFSKRGQAVWNAITIAIVVCLARDAMMEMKKHFEPIFGGDSDPDA
ncbi:hypothetical protein CCHL11_00475 [Colletotrichum chlorophyti]|uniref:Uncharacterized protein n=1 Tax=Colletotrichum chlorophyti TaxID=708187 RepID=A0A1Q8RUG7_9PEZI|nr:hypothetical protein CCHL11_00475 [Colletotrichum chlorophyti]